MASLFAPLPAQAVPSNLPLPVPCRQLRQSFVVPALAPCDIGEGMNVTGTTQAVAVGEKIALTALLPAGAALGGPPPWIVTGMTIGYIVRDITGAVPPRRPFIVRH
jgi:hypothetical protein